VPPPIFNHADRLAIETFAAAVQGKGAYAPIPSNLAVGGMNIPTRAVTAVGAAPGSTLGSHDLRACYSDTNRDILVGCGGIELPRSAPAALDHTVCVVGHEALHAIQRPHFSQVQIDQGSALGKTAAAGGTAVDYAAYIACDVELPAHAVMIALELRAATPTNFDASARGTAIYTYFDGKLTSAPQKAQVLQDLIPSLEDHDPLDQSRMPIDMMDHGWLTSLFQASQHRSTMSS